MATGIGTILREARNRRKIDLSEVEAATKIRVRYLRAIENEDWDVLPGDVYTRGFIRTYAAYLGLDGERLAAEHRGSSPAPADEPPPRAELATPAGRPSIARRISPRTWGVVVTLGLVALLVGVGLTGGDGDSAPAPAGMGGKPGSQGAPSSATALRPGVAVSLAATAEVWVCLLDAQGRPLVNGQILAAGAEEGPFRSGSFTVSLGNGEVSMTIDGEEADIPATSSPVGYSIERGGALQPLAEGERPTCT